MADFKIFETDDFLAGLGDDFRGQKNRIKKKLESFVYPQLRKQPYYGNHIKKLANYKPETWRYRIGDYRFFYTINGDRKIVFMLAVDIRGNAY